MANLSEDELMKFASDILETRAQVKMLNATREIMDYVGNIYGNTMKALDDLEKIADEDVNKVADIIDKRNEVRKAEKSLDDMVKSVKKMEDEVLPNMEKLLDQIVKYAGIE